MNPFVINEDGSPVPLDMVSELDDTALFKNRRKWGEVDFPYSFGQKHFPEELKIEKMDAKTGASLKLKIINPKGRIWNLVAGGGASVVFADTVTDLGMGSEMGNYGEYSGN